MNVFSSENIGNDPRQHLDWITTPLVKSYMWYLINNEDAFEVAQPSFFLYSSWCKSQKLTDPVVSLYKYVTSCNICVVFHWLKIS